MLTLTAALLLTASDVTPPPMLQAPTTANTTRVAKLIDSPRPSEPGELLARMVLAPVFGVIGGGLGSAVGLLGGGLIGVLAHAGIWGSVGLGVIGAAVFGFVGLALGAAIGASLFGERFGDLMGRSVPWAFLTMAVATAISVFAMVVVPVAALAISIGTGVVAAAVVPLIVEARRVAEVPVERAPEATVPVATF